MKKLTLYTLALALLGATGACENPLKDFDLQISTQVIRHTATLRIVDITGSSVSNVSVALASGDTQDIYNESGNRDFSPTGDLVTFGLDPKRYATPAEPVRFNASISAPGFITQTIPVTISGVSTGIETVVLVRTADVPDGVEEVNQNVVLVNNATAAATTVTLPAADGAGDIVLTIPANTQFRNAEDQIITGTNVQIVVSSINADVVEAQAVLPGGGLRASEVVLQDGSTAAGAFSPAAVSRIRMLVNGVPVRRFSQPLTVRMPVPASYTSPISGQAIAAGTNLHIFSSSNSAWRFEQQAAVQGTAATGFYVSFPVSHLSFYLAGEFEEACATERTITFSGDWMANGSSYPVTVEAVWGGGGRTIARLQYSVSAASATISVSNLPESNVRVVVRNSAGVEIASSRLGVCGETTQIVLPDPGIPGNPLATLQLYVRCPNRSNPITLLPTFRLYYRQTGTQQWLFLGTVGNGFLRTTLLRTDGTEYDFRAIWNNRVKVVGGHAIQVDNTATVGDNLNAGEILGEHAGATNLAILTEECENL